jgi:Peptidase family M1 domain
MQRHSNPNMRTLSRTLAKGCGVVAPYAGMPKARPCSATTARHYAFAAIVIWLALVVLASTTRADSAIHHEFVVALDPANAGIEARDTITFAEDLPTPKRAYVFWLDSGLPPLTQDPGVILTRLNKPERAAPIARFKLQLPAGQRQVTLDYRGHMRRSPQAAAQAHGKMQDAIPPSVWDEGIFLAGDSAWYPSFDDTLLTFELEIDLPVGWQAISQGASKTLPSGAGRVRFRWLESKPQQQIYLVAGRFHGYSRQADGYTAQVFLRTADENLAQSYLDATVKYIDLYGRLLGRYPYTKFALVENFWQTGYGMPSFTLLGSRVIRLPFILYSSYPHEILHNWWGNSVYVAPGWNWSEGLTTYLADHLIQEQRGEGAIYRRDVLQKYADFVSQSQDFPLSSFGGGQLDFEQAVGYGKALMFFHMLRLKMGDRVFIDALRRLYETKRYQQAGYADVQRAFAQASGLDLRAEFTQWIDRSGAPQLRLRDATVARGKGEFHLTGTIEQSQPASAYRLSVPFVVHFEGRSPPVRKVIAIDRASATFTLTFPKRPRALQVDPEFDVFRRLDREEIPASLGQLFGAERVLMVLPTEAPAPLREKYQALATQLRGDAEVEWRWDDTLADLPTDRAVFLFGWRNRFLGRLREALAGQDVSLAGENSISIGRRRVERASEAVVIAALQVGNPNHALVWLACDNPQAFAGLARKLPHYGKYSYLVFDGDAQRNVLKGQWPILHSPLSILFGEPGDTAAVSPQALPPRAALTAILN